MAIHGRRLMLLFAAVMSMPIYAQQPTVEQLEKRLDELTAQITQIREELARMKGAEPAPAQDLTQIEVAPAPAVQPTATPAPASSLADVETVSNVSNPAASKVFNPDISVVGNFLGKAGRDNPIEFGPDDKRPPMQLKEAELAFEAFVDPYAKAKFFLGVGPEGVEIEEAYANFITLPYDLTSKVGKMKSTFGKANTWHTHIRPWVDQPLVVHNFFGDEGLNDSGISVSKSINNPFNAFIEATGEVFSGDSEGVFERRSHNDLFYNAHLKVFRDITENSNVELGTSLARGTPVGTDGHSTFGGLDFTYRWKPLARGKYRGVIARVEAITNDRSGLDRNLKGAYGSVDVQIARRWFAGARLDAADRLSDSQRVTDRGTSLVLTFWPSEFSQLRTQLRRTSYGDIGRAVNEILFQLQFAIGAHGAHTF